MRREGLPVCDQQGRDARSTRAMTPFRAVSSPGTRRRFRGSSDFRWGAGLAAVAEGGYGSRSSMIGSDQATVRSEDLDVDQRYGVQRCAHH